MGRAATAAGYSQAAAEQEVLVYCDLGGAVGSRDRQQELGFTPQGVGTATGGNRGLCRKARIRGFTHVFYGTWPIGLCAVANVCVCVCVCVCCVARIFTRTVGARGNTRRAGAAPLHYPCRDRLRRLWPMGSTWPILQHAVVRTCRATPACPCMEALRPALGTMRVA